MSATHTWVWLLLWVGCSAQNKSPAPEAPVVTVTCFVSEDCLLPCSFEPDSEVSVEWFRQDVAILKLEQDEDNDSSEQSVQQEQFAGRASVAAPQVSRGDATLVLKKSSLKDRGTYRCQVQTSAGEHKARVILKVGAPITGLSVELSSMSGYEEMVCTANNVYPPPRVSWRTEPSTFEGLRPVTRAQANKDGLYAVNSRVRPLTGRPDLIYVCSATTSYGGPAWTTSLRAREIKGNQGKDLSIPCLAPPDRTHLSLEWSFLSGLDSSHILTYDSRSDRSTVSPRWKRHVALDGNGVSFGDGTLRLMDPVTSEHTGTYTCVFSTEHGTHTEHLDVIINGPRVGVTEGKPEEREAKKSSYWWVAVLVLGLLALAVVGLMVYLRRRRKAGNKGTKARNDPEGVTELKAVKDSAEAKDESSPLNEADGR